MKTFIKGHAHCERGNVAAMLLGRLPFTPEGSMNGKNTSSRNCCYIAPPSTGPGPSLFSSLALAPWGVVCVASSTSLELGVLGEGEVG